MEVQLLTLEGKESGRTLELDEDVFGITPNYHVIYLAVKQYLANRRQGTHKTKERGEVQGSTRKPYRQKGTGYARAGHIRSPLWRHGGTVFGPRPRDYNQKLNKKVKNLAVRSALSAKLQDGELIFLEDFDFERPSTKNILPLIQGLQLEGKRVTLVMPNSASLNVYLSARNIPKWKTVRAYDLNTYYAINNYRLLITESAALQLQERLLKKR